MAGPAFRRPTAVALVVLLVVFIAATVVRQEAKHRLSATQEPTALKLGWGDLSDTNSGISNASSGGKKRLSLKGQAGEGGTILGRLRGSAEMGQGLRRRLEEAVGVHVPEEGDKVGQPEWRGAQRDYIENAQGRTYGGPAPAARPRGVDEGGALTPMELAPGLPFAAGMIDSP